MPSSPSTLAISCGSQIAVVTPWRSDAAIEFERRDQRRFDVKMRVDEAGHAEEPASVDAAAALVVRMRADDAVADDRDVGARHRAGDDVEQLDIAR